VVLSAECTVLQHMSQMASDADRRLIAAEVYGGRTGRFGWRGCM
jgi:hypothetical protein